MPDQLRSARAHIREELKALLHIQTQTLIAAVRQELPVEAFDELQDRLDLSAADLAQLISISPRTLQRRRKEGRFKKDESDRLIRVAELLQLAMHVFEEDENRAVEWLTAPKPLFDGESPLERADTAPGRQEVEESLYAIEYSMPA